MTRDMTTGNPAKLIIFFSIPLLLGNIFQQLYSMADTIIVGNTIGVTALAAVGATGGLSFLVLGFVMGMTGGFAVITAQRFGAGDMDSMRHSVAVSIELCVAMTILLTAVSVATARPLLEFMNTPEDILEDSYAYIVVIYVGIFASVFYNMISSILRALGDSRTPLYFLILSSLLNIGLDLILILNFKMGVAGAAYATVASQVVSGLLCLVYISKKFPVLHLKKEDWRLDLSFMMIHLKIGLPMALQFSITAIGVVILQTALNNFGSTYVAAYTAASKVEQLATQPLSTFGTAIATYSAQNLGAGKYQRIREGVRKCSLISLVVCVVGAILVITCGHFMVRLFMSEYQADVMEAAQQYLVIVAIFFPPLGILFIHRNALQGIGDGFWPMMAGAVELVMRAFGAVAFANLWGYAGVCVSNPVAWTAAMLLLTFRYFPTIKRLVIRAESGNAF